MYKANRHFMKQIKDLDPKLGCEYNRNTEKFNVTYQRATGKAVPIMQVSTESGGFRQPDRRELLMLGEGDMCKTDRTTHLNKASKYCQDYRDKQAAESKDNIRGMTADNKLQLKSAFERLHGSGKSNSAFRRVKQRPRGKLF